MSHKEKRIFALANQKGGVGKTTTCINLCAALAILGKKILVIDLDPQGNATMGSGIDKTNLAHSVNELLLGNSSIDEVIISKVPAGYDLIPANSDLTVSEATLLKIEDHQIRLQQALAPIADRYDFIFIDCPPALNALTLNAMVAADAVLIAMQCEYYALEGLTGLLTTIREIQQNHINENLILGGIIRTMYDSRNKLCEDVSEQLLDHFGSKLFNTKIPRNIRLAEAPSYGLPIFEYDGNSRGAIAYIELAKEFVELYNPVLEEICLEEIC